MFNKNKSRNYSLRMPKNNLNSNKNQKNNIKTLKSVNYNKNKVNIRPPFNPGLFSYSKSIKEMNKNKKEINSRNIKKNNSNFFSSNIYSIAPNISKNSSDNRKNNYFNSIFLSTINKKLVTKNSLLSQSTINLNKYKISNSEHSNIRSVDSINNNNINKYVNRSINVNINFNYQKNSPKKEKNIKLVPHYKNYFAISSKYKIESRRMIIEYIKILNKKEKNIKNILLENNISQKVLNQKISQKNSKQFNMNGLNSTKINSNEILLGESKKDAFLNNLNYSLSETDNNSDTEEYFEPATKNKTFNQNNYFNNSMDKFSFVNSLNYPTDKRIKIINFLLTPKILNLIESNKRTKKYIFIVVPHENTYINGIENYKLIWRDIESLEIENEININDIKECFINEKYENRFNIIVQKMNNSELNFEIETPNKQICEYLVKGIEYISNNEKLK